MGEQDQARLDALIDDMIEVGRDLWEARLISSHGGNLSVRWGKGACITRTGAMLHRLDRGQFVTVDSHGRPVASGSTPEPSSDAAVHLAIYREVEEAQAVAHAHPVHAVAISLDWGALNPVTRGGDILGRVPVISAHDDEVADAVAAELREHPAVLVRAHGAFVRAADPWGALQLLSVLEEAAMILHLSSEE